jgi:hypothetical protein
MQTVRRSLAGGEIDCEHLTPAEADRLFELQYNFIRDERNQSYAQFRENRERWIDAHHPGDRVNARRIADELDRAHISFAHFERTFLRAVDAALASSAQAPIRRLAYVTDPTRCKSDNFFARLARYHRPRANFELFRLMQTPDFADEQYEGFIFDDCAYSGGQLFGMINNLLCIDRLYFYEAARHNCIVVNDIVDYDQIYNYIRYNIRARISTADTEVLIPIVRRFKCKTLLARCSVKEDGHFEIINIRKCKWRDFYDAARDLELIVHGDRIEDIKATHVIVPEPVDVNPQKTLHVVVPYMMQTALDKLVKLFRDPLVVDPVLRCEALESRRHLRVISHSNFDDKIALDVWIGALIVVITTNHVYIVRQIERGPDDTLLITLDREFSSASDGTFIDFSMISTMQSNTRVRIHMMQFLEQIMIQRPDPESDKADLRAYAHAIKTNFSLQGTVSESNISYFYNLITGNSQVTSLVTLGHKLPDYVSVISAPIVGCGLWISLAHIVREELHEDGMVIFTKELKDALILSSEEECLQALRPIVARSIGALFSKGGTDSYVAALRKSMVAILFSLRNQNFAEIETCSDSYVPPYKRDERMLLHA